MIVGDNERFKITTLVFDAVAADSTNKLASLIGGMGGVDLLIFSSGMGD